MQSIHHLLLLKRTFSLPPIHLVDQLQVADAVYDVVPFVFGGFPGEFQAHLDPGDVFCGEFFAFYEVEQICGFLEIVLGAAVLGRAVTVDQFGGDIDCWSFRYYDSYHLSSLTFRMYLYRKSNSDSFMLLRDPRYLEIVLLCIPRWRPISSASLP